MIHIHNMDPEAEAWEQAWEGAIHDPDTSVPYDLGPNPGIPLNDDGTVRWYQDVPKTPAAPIEDGLPDRTDQVQAIAECLMDSDAALMDFQAVALADVFHLARIARALLFLNVGPKAKGSEFVAQFGRAIANAKRALGIPFDEIDARILDGL